MKNFLIASTLLVSFIFLVGCKKAYDYIEKDPNAEIKKCLLEKIAYSDPWGTEDTVVFSYNKAGDPLTGIRTSPGTGAPNYVFKYDKKGNLTEFIGMYRNGVGSEFWHKYFYDGTGKIVLDSNYIFCRVQNGQPVDPALTPEPDGSSLTFYTYDARCRIIKDSTIYSMGWTNVVTYSYDVYGNRTGFEYDQNANFHRTNKIWMFLDRDYSISNPFIAESYNSMSLPTKIDLSSKGVLQQFLVNHFSKATITYSCK